MAKMVMVIDIPDETYRIDGELEYRTPEELRYHGVYLNENEINLRRRAYESLKNMLVVMGVD